MQIKWIMLALAATMTLAATGAADAQTRQRRVIVNQGCDPYRLSELIVPTCSVQRRGTKASPHVYSGGTYVGQDPDPRIRAQLRREFDTGANGLN